MYNANILLWQLGTFVLRQGCEKKLLQMRTMQATAFGVNFLVTFLLEYENCHLCHVAQLTPCHLWR